jgi:hypothetical protein
VIEEGMDDKNKVACVAMEYTPVTGANGGQPLTKFFTFGPDETLLLSINLDGRGEKVHARLLRRLPWRLDLQRPFPRAGDGFALSSVRAFLPFDTGNYLFSSQSSLSEASQSEAFYQLNQLVLATEVDPNSATSRLINGWYANGTCSTRSSCRRSGSWPMRSRRRPVPPVLQGGGRHLVPHLPRVARRKFRLGRHRPRPFAGEHEFLRRDGQHRRQCVDAECADLARPAVREDRGRRLAGGAGGEIPRLLRAAARPGL